MTLEAPIPSADEFALLACAIDGGLDIASEIVASVPVGAFGDDGARQVRVVVEKLTSEPPIDGVRLFSAWTKAHGKAPMPPGLDEAFKSVASPSHFPHYVQSVLDAARRRRLQGTLFNILSRIHSPQHEVAGLIAEAERALAVEEISLGRVLSAKQAAQETTDDLERRFEAQGKLTGVATGWPKLDSLMDGLQYGQQTIVAARPSIGKTVFGMNVVAHACLTNQVPTVFVTCEMSPASLCRRMIAGAKDITMGALRSGNLSEFEIVKATGFVTQLRNAPLWIVDGISKPLDCSTVCAIIRRLVRRHGVKLVVIDYLTKIKPTSRHEKRTYEVAEVSEALRGMAVSCNIALCTLAQLNRESEKGPKRGPRLSDLADSGQIERDGDAVVLLDRERTEPVGDAQFIVAKQRDGAVDIVHVKFNGPYARFENL